MPNVIHLDELELSRHGLVRILSGTDFQVTASVGTLNQAIAAMNADGQAILVTDIVFGGKTDAEPLHAARERHMRACVFSMHHDGAQIDLAKAAGAGDYLLFTDAARDTITRLTCVAKGTRHEKNSFARGARPRVSTRLTDSERQVVAELEKGGTNKDIGTALGISHETVKEHLKHAMRKMGVIDRTQAALWWLRYGMTAVSA